MREKMTSEIPDEKLHAIQSACQLIDAGDIEGAKSEINAKYPFVPFAKAGRVYTPRVMTKTFVRDGFIDRYRGNRLVYPPALRLLSHYLPDAFPYHKNGKMSVGHIAYWEVFPTIDHIRPVALGGPDTEDNWACCSMLTNSIKSNWTLEQLRWRLLPQGEFSVWDGMISWFLNRVREDDEVLASPYIQRWHSAAMAVIIQAQASASSFPCNG